MISIHGDNPFNAIETALTETFEGMAFSQVFDRSECHELPEFPCEILATRIELPEPVGIKVTTIITKAHLQNLLSNLMPGLDPISDEILTDFAHEVTNTAAGHINTILSTEKRDMTIGLPFCIPKQELVAAVAPGPLSRIFWFQVEEFEIWVSIKA